MNHTYQAFEEQARELAELCSVLNTLTWDQETMIPPLASPLRAGQLSTLAAVCHQRLTSPKMGETLEQLKEADLDLWQRASVREMGRQYDKAVRVPETLVRELAKTTSLAYQAWVVSRSNSDFSTFAPWLKKVVELKREEARCLQSSGSLYEALLDEYEPAMTVHELDDLFETIRPRLTSLLERIQSSGKHPSQNFQTGDFPISRQESFGRAVLTAMGFEWDAGRLDCSPHPFCTGLSPLDVRITTRYNQQDFTASLFGIIHEGGHALYEQGLDSERYGLPACDAISLGIHESQSRLWENQVARNGPFWEYWLPRLQKTFPGQLDQVSLDDFVHAINRVEATFIRVEADEVTYGLHVILRYEIEKLLIEEDLEVEDLENTWNQKTSDYLGIVPSDPAEGVLQDTHWSQGLIGYFPTYLLGTVYASQIFDSAEKSIPELSQHFRAGRLYPLREWLREKIHKRGKTVQAPILIQEITGDALNSSRFLDYLEDKFGALYDLKS